MTVQSMIINSVEIEITAKTFYQGVASSFRLIKDGKVMAEDDCSWIKRGKFISDSNRPAVLDFIAKVESVEAATDESKAFIAEGKAKDAEANDYYNSREKIAKAMSY
jgi:hypothetical protein